LVKLNSKLNGNVFCFYKDDTNKGDEIVALICGNQGIRNITPGMDFSFKVEIDLDQIGKDNFLTYVKELFFEFDIELSVEEVSV
jgi:hypothetical protein